MEITNVEVSVVNIGVTGLEDDGIAPYVTNHGQVEDVDRAIVRVETDVGITGWGEIRTFLSPETTRAILEEGLAPWVLGRSPYELESLRRQLFIEYTNADMFFAPIETACWDIVGKDLGKPIYELLGGWTAPSVTGRTDSPDRDATQRVDAAYCIGILSPEKSREHAAQALDEGYPVLKTKAGRDWREDVDRIVAMHDEVNGDLDFRRPESGLVARGRRPCRRDTRGRGCLPPVPRTAHPGRRTRLAHQTPTADRPADRTKRRHLHRAQPARDDRAWRARRGGA